MADNCRNSSLQICDVSQWIACAYFCLENFLPQTRCRRQPLATCIAEPSATVVDDLNGWRSATYFPKARERGGGQVGSRVCPEPKHIVFVPKLSRKGKGWVHQLAMPKGYLMRLDATWRVHDQTAVWQSGMRTYCWGVRSLEKLLYTMQDRN